MAPFLGFVLLGLITLTAMPLRGTGRTIRRPTPDELDAIADPLARVACRRLPMQALGPDLIDLTHAAKATSDYLAAGPLLVPNITTLEDQ